MKKINNENHFLFKDFDLIHVKGNDLIKSLEPTFPYVECIKEPNNNLKIIIHGSAQMTEERKFSKKDWGWEGYYLYKEGETISKYYTFHMGDTLKELCYSKRGIDGGEYLTSVSVQTENEKITYSIPYSLKLNLSPTYDLSVIPLEKAVYKDVASTVVKDKILLFKLIRYNLTEKEKLMGKTLNEYCYHLGELTKFWWNYLGHKAHKVNCDYYK